MRLGQIRRRLCLLAAVEGAVAGAGFGAVVAAAGLTIARVRGLSPPAAGIAAAIVLASIAGALARGTRRISLARCARIADAALGGHDRLLSALALEELTSTPFSRALVADADRRAAALVPRVVVPARRPAGLPALGIAGLAIVGAALVPTASRAARVIPAAAPAELGTPLPAASLDAEREAARAAAAEAVRLGDERLAALAAELDRALRRLASGRLSDGEALDLLGEIAGRASEASRDARLDKRGAEAAARTLEASADTHEAGAALARSGQHGQDADDRAREALGLSASENPAQTARALAATAASLPSPGNGEDGAEGASTAGRRHLARNDQNAASASASGAARPSDREERRLERLRRDLDDAASSCRAGDPSCRARAEERARDLSRLGRQGAAEHDLERLAQAARQLRARIGRGELRDGDGQTMRGFGRAAAGEGAEDEGTSAGEDDVAVTGETEQGDGKPGGGTREAQSGSATTSPSTALGTEGGDAPGSDEGGTGNGIGHQPGGAPLGRRGDDAETARGSKANVPLADGAGPSRAEVIGTAAGHGFASPSYARAFVEYAAAVEDALDTTAVPEGKRYLVRRYFDLIRPRPPARGSKEHR
jgi:hypothetical protein